MPERRRRVVALVGWTVALVIGVYHGAVAVSLGALLFGRGSAAPESTSWMVLIGASLLSTLPAVLTARRSRRIASGWLFGAAAAGALGIYRLQPELRSLAHALLLLYGPQLAIGVVLLAGRRVV